MLGTLMMDVWCQLTQVYLDMCHITRVVVVVCCRQNRLMAYRAFVSWMKKGKCLGNGVRVVIPSCVVNCICDKFPALDGQYTGFHFAEYPVW